MTIYLTPEAPCSRCRQPIGWCLETCPEHPARRALSAPTRLLRNDYPHPVNDGLTITGVIRAVNEAPQSHAEGRTAGARVPVRYVVLLFLGFVLMGFGLAADSIGALIYGVIPR